MGEKVKIKGTNDKEIACTLADLAGFLEGSTIGRTNNIYHRELNKECVVCFHKETLNKVGNDHPMLLGLDFIVIQVHKRPEGEAIFKPTDEYLIELNYRIDSSLIGKIEEEIKAYERK